MRRSTPNEDAQSLAAYILNELATGGATMACFDSPTIDEALATARAMRWIGGGTMAAYRITPRGAEATGTQAGTLITETRRQVRRAWAEALSRGN